MTALDPKFGEVEIKITDASSLVKKKGLQCYNISEAKYFTASDYNKFEDDIHDTKLKQKNLTINSNFDTVWQRTNKNKVKTTNV